MKWFVVFFCARVLFPPVELSCPARRRRILCDDKSEADSERAEPRYAESAHGEVFVILKNLDDDRTFRREFLLRGQLGRRFCEKTCCVSRKHIFSLRGVFKNKRATLCFFEVTHRVEQVERVLGPD